MTVTRTINRGNNDDAVKTLRAIRQCAPDSAAALTELLRLAATVASGVVASTATDKDWTAEDVADYALHIARHLVMKVGAL